MKEGYKLAMKEYKEIAESYPAHLQRSTFKQSAYINDDWIPADEFSYSPKESGYQKLVKQCEDKNGTPVKIGNYIAYDNNGNLSKKAKVLAIYECDKKKCGWLKPDTTHEIVAIWQTTVDKRKFVKVINVENSEAVRVSSTGKVK